MPSFAQWSALELALRVRARELSLDEVTDFYQERLTLLGNKLNAHLFFDPLSLAQEKKRVEALLKTGGHALPLAGVPVFIKDNISVAGMPMTCASRFLKAFKPAYDATAVKRLKEAGALIWGKTNMDEFGMGSSNEHSAFGPALNPWDHGRVAGGSSGGSAAAVSAGLSPLALGSDTGGSIRQPASFCGVVGFKPSYGHISRFGLTAYASSLDHVGPFAYTVAEVAAVYEALAGYDSQDGTSCEQSVSKGLGKRLQAWQEELKGLKVGLIREHLDKGVEPEVARHVRQAAATLAAHGARVEELSIDKLKYALATYYILATAEASSNLARFDGIRYGSRELPPGASLKEIYLESRSRGFGREVQQRIMLGTFILSAGYGERYYQRACRARELLRQEFSKAFSQFDILLGPSSPSTAFRCGEKLADPLAMYLSDLCTIPANLVASPALSLPCGFDRLGLPIGLQFWAAAHGDSKLLTVAHAYQQLSDWHRRCKEVRFAEAAS